MAGLVKVLMVAVVVVVSAAIGVQRVDSAQVHQVVRGESGWNPASESDESSSSDEKSSDEKGFRVGDRIWFTDSMSQDNVVELKSKEEYEACDVSNPIKLFTDGVDLAEEGIRYFASATPESCKNGLKLHVEVQAQEAHEDVIGPVASETYGAPADGPSAATHLNGLSYLLLIGILVSYYLKMGM